MNRGEPRWAPRGGPTAVGDANGILFLGLSSSGFSGFFESFFGVFFGILGGIFGGISPGLSGKPQ